MATSFLKVFSVIILVLVAVFPPKLCCLEIDVDPRNYGQDTMQQAHSSKTDRAARSYHYCRETEDQVFSPVGGVFPTLGVNNAES